MEGDERGGEIRVLSALQGNAGAGSAREQCWEKEGIETVVTEMGKQ